MRYFLAIVCPPLAVLLCRKGDQAFISLLLTLCFWIPGMIHALVVVHRDSMESRGDGVVREMRQHRLNSVIRRL